MKTITKSITSIIGAIGAVAGLSVPLDGCDEGLSTYGPLPASVLTPEDCCYEFKTTGYEQYYGRCLEIAQTKDLKVVTCDEVIEETRQSVEQP